MSKTSASVSSGVPNTEKQIKARGRRPSAFIVSSFYCFELLLFATPLLNITENGGAIFGGMRGLHYGPSSQTYTTKGLPLVDDLKFVHFSRNLRIAQ